MTTYKCTKCGKLCYTSNTRATGKPCEQCGAPIEKLKTAGRSPATNQPMEDNINE